MAASISACSSASNHGGTSCVSAVPVKFKEVKIQYSSWCERSQWLLQFEKNANINDSTRYGQTETH